MYAALEELKKRGELKPDATSRSEGVTDKWNYARESLRS
jgi:hypothetical protein